MTYKGAIFFDYDGTLADEANHIFLPTEATRKTVAKLKEKGYAIFLATGRSKCYIPDIPGFFDGYVAANGAYSEINGKCLSSIEIDKETLDGMKSEFDKLGLEYSFENQEALFVSNMNSKAYISMLNTFEIPLDIMRPLDEGKNICKGIMLFNSEKQFEELRKRFEGVALFYRHRTYNSADIAIPGVDKGVGVRNVIEKLGIPYENTYAFGDGTNDIEMIKSVCHGVAMGESVDGAREVAEYITDTVINEGITKAFEHYGLM